MEAYVAVDGNGSLSYYDLSEDIVSGSVTRNQDAASTFEIVLANKNGKYDDLFTPMDRIVIYLSKVQRYRTLTGYITSATKFNVYGSHIRLVGADSIYRLQRLYWDPGLLESRRDVLAYQNMDAQWSTVIRNLLTKVGGYSDGDVVIGQIPQSAIDWAYGLYAAKIEDMGQARDMANAFYDMLSSAGPKTVGGGASGSSTGLGAGGVGDVKLPDGLGTYATREFDLRTDRVATGLTSPYGFGLSTNQRRVQDAWIAAGAEHDSQGFCKLDGKYLVATTSVFGEIGSHTTFYFSNNTSIETIKVDAKAEEVVAWDPNPANKWGHANGACVLEFCGEDRIGDNPYLTLGLNGVTVTSATVHGVVC